MRHTNIIAAILLSLAVTGCGTIGSRVAAGSLPKTQAGIYRGVRFDAEVLRTTWHDKDPDRFWLTPLLAVDFPLSAATDTLLLPWDLWKK